LWDLVWSGEVTNDTLAPLRALVAPESARRLAERGGAARVVPPEASGRWSLVSASVSADPGAARRLVARVDRILHLHGVLTRETIRAESMPGGFGGLYQVLKSMEESGRLRRGYFVAGFGANQFALPEAVERLRALRAAGERPVTVLVAATDPASPYGSTLPWPDGPGNRRPMRVAGALVVLVDGALAAWIARGEHQILTFLDGVPDRSPEEVAREVAAGLAARVDTRKRRVLFVEEVDGRPAQDSALAAALELHGFRRTPRGYLRKAGHGTLA
jgi:ATP-dependent Lhr-like helicase